MLYSYGEPDSEEHNLVCELKRQIVRLMEEEADVEKSEEQDAWHADELYRLEHAKDATKDALTIDNILSVVRVRLCNCSCSALTCVRSVGTVQGRSSVAPAGRGDAWPAAEIHS